MCDRIILYVSENTKFVDTHFSFSCLVPSVVDKKSEYKYWNVSMRCYVISVSVVGRVRLQSLAACVLAPCLVKPLKH